MEFPLGCSVHLLKNTGTTFAVISSASGSVNLAETRVGSVLVSAAVIDDVVGLVMLRCVSREGMD